MNIYDNQYARYNNLMTLFIGLYAATMSLTDGIFKTSVAFIALVGWIISLDKSKREYYKLIEYVAKETR